MYFGVLHKCEYNIIQKKDVIIKEDHIDIMFDKPAKWRNEGFTHKVPGWMKGTLEICISQLDKCRDDNSRFISNMNDKRRTRIQNMAKHTLSKMAKELAARLGEDSKNYTAKSFCWSAAT